MSRLVSIAGGADDFSGYGCGAVVSLRSGGMPMTVRCALKNAPAPTVTCDWVTPEGVPYSGDYLVVMLTRAEPLARDVGGGGGGGGGEP